MHLAIRMGMECRIARVKDNLLQVCSYVGRKHEQDCLHFIYASRTRIVPELLWGFSLNSLMCGFCDQQLLG